MKHIGSIIAVFFLVSGSGFGVNYGTTSPSNSYEKNDEKKLQQKSNSIAMINKKEKTYKIVNLGYNAGFGCLGQSKYSADLTIANCHDLGTDWKIIGGRKKAKIINAATKRCLKVFREEQTCFCFVGPEITAGLGECDNSPESFWSIRYGEGVDRPEIVRPLSEPDFMLDRTFLEKSGGFPYWRVMQVKL